MKKLLFCLGCCLLLSGCGSYRELNDVVIVSGGGLEQEEGQPITLVSQLVTLPEGGDTPKTELAQVSGQTPAAAFDALSALTGKAAYWSHCQTFLLGENLARSGLSQTINTLVADPEIRLTDRLLVTAGVSPEDTLKATAAAGEISGYDLYTLVSSQTSDLNMPLYRFADTLADWGIDPILPAVTLDDQGKPALLGAAVFQEDRLAGYLGTDQTLTLLLLRGKVHATPLTTASGNTYILDTVHCRIVPAQTENGLVFTIHLTVKARLDSPSGSEENLKQALKERISVLIPVLQKDLQADSLGLMRQARRYLSLSDQTDEETAYRQARIRTNISVSLSQTGSVTHPQEVNSHA